MPGYRGHIAGATLMYGGLVYLVSCALPVTWVQATEWYLCMVLGALFPDIDTKSKGQKIFYRAGFVYLLFFIVSPRFSAERCGRVLLDAATAY